MTAEALAFERGVTPLLEKILPARLGEILEFRPDAGLERRIEELAAKSTEGELTAEERAEYEGYVRANKFVAILRREASRLAKATS